MRWVLSIGALAALAQSPPAARIDAGGAPSPMIVGSTAQLIATARDAAGRVIPNAPLTWTSGNPAAFSVDAQGLLRATGLGEANITVSSGNARGGFWLSSAPLRVEVEPAFVTLLTGDRHRFTARVLDVNRQPIPGVRVDWLVLGPSGVSVDQDGTLNASIAGRFTVRATIGGVWGYATVQINPRPSYRLTRAFSNDPIPGPHSVGAFQPAVFSETGLFAVGVNLNGWARQVLLWDNGQFHPLAAVGETNWDSFVTKFAFRGPNLRNDLRIGGVTSRGEVLLCCDDLLLAARGRVNSVLMANTWLGTARDLWRFGVGRRSINEAGEIAFTAASFQYIGNNTTLHGVFKLLRNRLTIIWSSDQPLEGLHTSTAPASPISLVNPMIDGQGTVYFVATLGGVSGLYGSIGFQPPKRILGPGDSVAGESVANVSNTASGAIVNESGDLAVRVTLADNRTGIVRIRAGGQRQLLLAPDGPVYGVNSAGAVLFHHDGLRLWEDETSRPVLLHGEPAPDNGAVTSIDGAGLTNAGGIYAQMRTSLAATLLMKIDGPVYLRTGDSVGAAAPPALLGQSLVRGGGPLRLRLATGSLFEVGPTGLQPVILSGAPEAVAGGSGFVDTGPQGIYFAAPPNRLVRRVGDRYETVAAAGGPIDRFAVNLQGHAVLVSNQRLYLFDGAATSLLADGGAPAPSGGVFTAWSQIAIDGRDRILALANTSNGASGLFLYDGAWRTVLLVGQFRFQTLLVRAVSSIRANQDRFFALLVADGGAASVASFRDDWRPELSFGDPIRGSAQTVGGILAFDVNQQGDILARVFNGNDDVVVRTAAGVNLVVNSEIPIAGSYFGRQNEIGDMIIQDDGTIYLGGLDQFGRYIIVRGEPL